MRLGGLAGVWILALIRFAAPPEATPAPAGPQAVVLGIAQDGGVPHLGCRQALCVEARRDPGKHRRVAALGILDPAAGKRFLIDATPDFPDQVEHLGGMPDAILLTHAHVGHYLGLAGLGREVANTRRLPVYCTASMARFLRENRPWSRLVERENIEIRQIEPGKPLALTPQLTVTALKVPHRDEDSDTVAYLVAGPRARLLWLPDIDRWEKWERRLEEFASDAAMTLLIDGTFFSSDEIPGRAIEDIPHPLVPDTVARLLAAGSPAARVLFVHLNHTNRLLWDEAAVKTLQEKGFDVAREGQVFPL